MITTFTRTWHYLGDAIGAAPRYIDSEGGTRSGKTFAALQWLVILAKQDAAPTLTSVVSETMPHLRRGAVRDFKVIMQDEWNEVRWSKVNNIYTLPNGSQIEFFSADQPGKVHGPARDRLFINEAVNIDYETARQLFVRTRGIIICDYNPTHAFWMHEHIAPRDNCISIHSTFEDNDYLTDQQRAEILSNKGDSNWWRVYGEGKVGVLEGVIYDFEQVDTLPDAAGLVETYGMDFGFTNDPTALVHCIIDTRRRIIWADECIYRTGMLNADIADAMDAEGVPRGAVMVFADCAEPKTIEELYRKGWNILPCYKATRKAEQIQRLRGFRLMVTKRSLNLIRELRSYVWAKDKNGNSLNEPIAVNDHAMDALRYGVFSYLAEYDGSRLTLGFGSEYE